MPKHTLAVGVAVGAGVGVGAAVGVGVGARVGVGVGGRLETGVGDADALDEGDACGGAGELEGPLVGGSAVGSTPGEPEPLPPPPPHATDETARSAKTASFADLMER